MKAHLFAIPVLLAACLPGFSHVIPDEITAQAFVKPEADTLHVLVRVPFDALADLIPPLKGDGELDLNASRPMLNDAANTWISEWIDLYEGGVRLPQPKVARTIVSLVT